MRTSAEALARTHIGETGPTARIASIVAGVTSSKLDAQAIAAVKLLIADGIAVAVAGSTEDAPRIVAAHVKESGCRADASVWSFGFKTSPSLAAYANAVSMHVLDFEPMSSPPTHAVSPTLPVALALGEVLGANGCEIVTACGKGFEMQGRVLLASSHDRGSLPFHTPGVVGVMGSAVAASHLLGLDPVRIQHALGIAASRCAGLSANTGSMVKCTHCGNVAQAGLEGKFSFQYTVAAALLDGKVGIETFTDARRFSADMVALLDRIELTRDPTRSRDTRGMRVTVTVTLRDGTTHGETCERPPASWGAPIDAESHRAKVRSCLGVRLPEGEIAAALELLGRLEELGSEDVSRLMTLLRGVDA